MKKLAIIAFSALALTACGKAETSASAGSSMSAMPGGSTTAAAKTGDTTGVVVAVDASAGTVKLDHQPIPGVGWPAMTMTFKATPPNLLNGLQPGDHVRFTVRVEGDNSEVTAIAKQG